MELNFQDFGRNRYEALIQEAQNEALAAQVTGRKSGLLVRITGLITGMLMSRRTQRRLVRAH
jgi:hypothetical protein